MSNYFDANEVKKAISLMKPDGQLFECRMLEGSKIYSGYFTDAETLVNALSRENLRDRNVYITLNEIDSLFHPGTERPDNRRQGHRWL